MAWKCEPADVATLPAGAVLAVGVEMAWKCEKEAEIAGRLGLKGAAGEGKAWKCETGRLVTRITHDAGTAVEGRAWKCEMHSRLRYRTCDICGEDFETRNPQQRTCSESCKREKFRRTQLRYRARVKAAKLAKGATV